ncbi:MAG: endonuclease/exonuclease/phosphatase family protein [Deltaproteobacteria bacterium]|nr:endonuclease/exonuclease/phosphatase family protein [Deltaproteobacteria bacterium]
MTLATEILGPRAGESRSRGSANPGRRWWALAILCALAACDPPLNADSGLDAAVGDADGGGGDAALDSGRDAAGRDLPGRDASCGLAAVGTPAKFDLATWNLQEFPLAGDATVDLVARILFDLQLDLIAVQEITDMRDFQVMLSLMPGYSGRVSSDSYAFQRPGLIYRTDMIAIDNVQLLFDDNNEDFPRAPLQVDVVATDPQGSASYAFTIIVVHLKAGATEADETARRNALVALKTHLDQQQVANPDRDYLLIGDFNDKLTDSAAYNVFQPFLDDSADYRFLDLQLARNGEWSWIGTSTGTMIDHILIADQGDTDFAGDQTRVLHLEQQVAGYQTTVSDHRPVVTSVEPVAWR